jgi:hypothetical protein
LPFSQYASFGGVVALGSGMSHPSKECCYLCSELVSLIYEDRSRGIYEAVANKVTIFMELWNRAI